MKYPISILSLGLALLPLASVRADDAKTKFQKSLVVPLSRAESAQLDSLFKARQKAANSDQSFAADEAIEKFETSKRLRAPAEVRAQRPRGATTLYVGKFPIGTGGKPVLIHIWTAARQTSDSNYRFEGPCYVDAFNKGNGKAAKWQRAARSMYQGDGFPDVDGVSTRWLYPAKKQGPVLSIVSSVYMHTDCIVVTYPKGIGTSKKTPSYAQDLSTSGGWVDSNGYGFGTDKRGMMTITVMNLVGGKYKGDGTPVKTVLAWNGHQYAAPTKRK